MAAHPARRRPSRRRRCRLGAGAAALLAATVDVSRRCPCPRASALALFAPPPRQSRPSDRLRLDGGFTRGVSCAAASSSSSSAAAEAETHDDDGDGEVIVSFSAPPQKVYIEDTDAYGVIYNSNYLRIYDRALHWAGIHGRVDYGSGSVGGGGVLSQEDWYITEVDGQKFRLSPPLGGEFVVEGTLKGRTGDGSREVWEVRMTAPRGGDEEDGVAPILFNSAAVTIAKPDDVVDPALLPPKPDPFPRTADRLSVEFAYVPYRDEYDLHLGPTHLPLQACLNLFERSRSDFMGGPDELQRMRDEAGIVWVVTKVTECALVNIGHAPDEEDAAPPSDDEGDGEAGGDEGDGEDVVRCRPGGEVTVRTEWVPKRRGAVMECRHTLLVKGTERRRRLAQAVFTMMALNDETRRPARDVPGWFKDKIGLTD